MTSETDRTAEFTEKSVAVYGVSAVKQEDGHWALTAELPGGPLVHTVRTFDDNEWVTRELKTVIAAHLGVDDDSFRLRIHVMH